MGTKKKRYLDVEHLGLITAAIAACVVAIRILAVCGWDRQTAFVFLQEQGTTAALTGTLLDVMPVAIVYFLYVVFYFGLPDQRENRARFAVLLTLLALAATVSIAAQPLIGLILEALLVYAIFQVRRRMKRERKAFEDRFEPIDDLEDLQKELEEVAREALEIQAAADEADLQKVRRLLQRTKANREELERNAAVVERNRAQLDVERENLRQAKARNVRIENWLLVGIGATVLAPALLSPPWLPLEQVGGERPAVGWVLSQSDHELVVLERDERRALQLPPDTPHRYCVPRPAKGRINEVLYGLTKPAFLSSLNSSSAGYPWCEGARSKAVPGSS